MLRPSNPGWQVRVQHDLERYRSYLALLARAHWPAALRARVDPSDLVQQTLLEAHRDRAAFRGEGPAELVGWLRQILGHRMARALRDLRRQKRNPERERSLDEPDSGFDAETAVRLASRLAAPDPTPSQLVQDRERLAAVVRSMEKLPAAQQEVLVLRFWGGQTLADIARHLQRSPPAVAALLYRGLQQLQRSLAEDDDE